MLRRYLILSRVYCQLFAVGFLFCIFQQPTFAASDVLPNTALTVTGTTSVASTTLPSGVQVQTVGNPQYARLDHTATLLLDGRVLIIGGREDNPRFVAAELFDPNLNIFIPTGNLNVERRGHIATLLANGKVLITGGYKQVGGFLNSAEIYDPETGLFTETGNLNQARQGYGAILLPNGKVLIAGGYKENYTALPSTELYDPTTGIFTFAAVMNEARSSIVVEQLLNGQILFMGGIKIPFTAMTSAELYDPVTETFAVTGSLNRSRKLHAATILSDGRVFVAGGLVDGMASAWPFAEIYDPSTGLFTISHISGSSLSGHTLSQLPDNQVLVIGGQASAELYDVESDTSRALLSSQPFPKEHTATVLHDNSLLIAGGCCASEAFQSYEGRAVRAFPFESNTITGSLTLPQGWITQTSVAVVISGTSSLAPVTDGTLGNSAGGIDLWHKMTAGMPLSLTKAFKSDGPNQLITLYLRDSYERYAAVVTGTVDIDSLPPTSAMTSLLATSPSTITLAWSGSDTTSGVAVYDVQVRNEPDGEWKDVVLNTPTTATVFFGENGHTYAFRVRAKDIAGNIEQWLPSPHTTTTVDLELPVSSLLINGGAKATTSRNVSLLLTANDLVGSVDMMRLSNDGISWRDWRTYDSAFPYSLVGLDGYKTVYAQVGDQAGNSSQIVSATILLDEMAGQQNLVSINSGVLWTNIVTVSLTIGAPPGTTQMQISNDGGFGGATWQPFDTHPSWQITSYGNYVIPRTLYVRLRLADTSLSNVASDDIIYDPEPPTGSVAIVPLTGVSAANTSVILTLSATDNVSGVSGMMISNNSHFAGARWQPFEASYSWALDSGNTVYVRFQDNAGNMSKSYIASIDALTEHMYLPLVSR